MIIVNMQLFAICGMSFANHIALRYFCTDGDHT